MKTVDISNERKTLDALAPKLWRIGGGVGVACLALAVVLALVLESAGQRFFHSYLVSYMYMLSIALGALLFVMLQHITRAGWSVVVRRLAEGMSSTLPLLAVLFLPILLFGMGHLYAWTDPDKVAHDHLLQHKQAYLNMPFFVIRAVIYFAIWIWLARTMFAKSVQQDRTGDVGLTLQMERLSAPGILLFALTVTFAAFDWLMALDAHWFSTIFGLYYFAGCMVAYFAALPLFATYLQSTGRLRRAISVEHYHDQGKLLFGFIVFWAYLAYSQYMLIWYANLPEETYWMAERGLGIDINGWSVVSGILLFGFFVLPFLALISRYPKRRPRMLSACAVWMLVMHYVDLYWLVMPTSKAHLSPVPHVIDALLLVGLGGLFVAGCAYGLRNESLICERDPRLEESLAFENA